MSSGDTMECYCRHYFKEHDDPTPGARCTADTPWGPCRCQEFRSKSSSTSAAPKLKGVPGEWPLFAVTSP
jgi:hypothetical protein